MKKLTALILAILMVLSLCACGNEKSEKKEKDEKTTTKTTTETVTETVTEPSTETPEQPEDDSPTPLLYKVTDSDGDVIWLLGSIHVGEDYMYPLPDYVYNAFDNSDYLAVECDVVSAENDMAASQALLSKLVYTDGTTINDHISEDVYKAGIKLLSEAGYYNIYFDYYMPIMWSTLIDQLSYEYFGFDMMKGIDRHMMARAEEKGLPLVEVESVESQYDMMANFSAPLQEILLDASIEGYKNDEMKEELKNLLKIWCRGDEEELSQAIHSGEDEIEPHEQELYEEYIKEMETDRNLLMTDFAEDALKNSEEAFIVVGAAHVVGDDGMASQLKDRGYTVEIVR